MSCAARTDKVPAVSHFFGKDAIFVKIQSIPRRLLGLILALALCLSGGVSAAAADTYSTIRLVKTQGTVNVTKASGNAVTLREKLRLYSGYTVSTAASSYAWINLDDTKAAKLDANSKLEIRQSGKKLELLQSSGKIFFNVTAPLEEDESMVVRTSTMVTGVRGTCGWVEVLSSTRSRLWLLSGHVLCAVTDPVSGETNYTSVQGGERADFLVNYLENGPRCEAEVQELRREDIPGCVLVELLEQPETAQRILEETGVDLTDLTLEEVREKLDAEQEEQERILEEIIAQQGEDSSNRVWEGETGHIHTPSSRVQENRIAATCTAFGSYDEVVYCTGCGQELIRSTLYVSPLGHDWQLTNWEWTGYSSATATFTCQNDETHAQQVTASVTSERTDPSCEEPGSVVYTASVTFEGKTYTDEKTETLSANGHDYELTGWSWTGYTAATATFTCKNDSTHVQRVTATITDERTDPSCEEPGSVVYTASVSFEGKTYTDEKTEPLSASGHDYELTGWSWTGYTAATAIFTCKNDETHVQRVTATIADKRTDPSCEESGSVVYTATVTFEGKTYTDKKTELLSASGHDYELTDWSWTGYTAATATFTCKNDSSHVQRVTATITDKRTDPGCEEPGSVVYTATVTFGGKTYTDEKTEPLSASGHDYELTGWSWTGYTAATATFTCQNDETHAQTVTARITDKRTDPSCEEPGSVVYTATVTFGGKTYTDEKTEPLSATGHDWQFTTWNWTANYGAATAKYVCRNDREHTNSAEAAVTTVETPEERIYIATVPAASAPDGQERADKQRTTRTYTLTVTIENPELGKTLLILGEGEDSETHMLMQESQTMELPCGLRVEVQTQAMTEPDSEDIIRVDMTLRQNNGQEIGFGDGVFNMPSADSSLRLRYVRAYEIDAEAENEDGKLTVWLLEDPETEPYETGLAAKGETVLLRAQPAPGRRFAGATVWSEEEKVLFRLKPGADKPDEVFFPMPGERVIVLPQFLEEGVYAIDIADADHGWIDTTTPEGSISSAEPGTRVFIEAYPDQGYELQSLSCNGSEQPFGQYTSYLSDPECTDAPSFDMPAEDVELVATFAVGSYGLRVECQIDGEDADQLPQGLRCEFLDENGQRLEKAAYGSAVYFRLNLDEQSGYNLDWVELAAYLDGGQQIEVLEQNEDGRYVFTMTPGEATLRVVLSSVSSDGTGGVVIPHSFRPTPLSALPRGALSRQDPALTDTGRRIRSAGGAR